MKKPTIYLDTNIVSMLHYDGSDIDALSSRMVTRDWWESERRHFEIFASSLTERELADGVYRYQADCLKFVRRLKYVSFDFRSRQLTQALLDAKVIPINKPGDAAQLALAASHDMDYLLTWNSHTWRSQSPKHGVKRLLKVWGYECRCLFLQSQFPKFNSDTQSGDRVMVNPIVEQSWKVREKLIEQFGGMDGLFDELQRLDRQRIATAAAKKKRNRQLPS